MSNIKKKKIYTRNIEPLNKGSQLSNITFFDQREDEFNLHDQKGIKIILSIPTLSNSYYIKELAKLDTILKDYPKVTPFVVSNEPVFTQKRLTKSSKYECLKVLSDFKNREFARESGTYIYELSQLMKAVFILNAHNNIVYIQYIEDLQTAFDANEIVNTIQELL